MNALLGNMGSNSKSPGQILEKSCERTRGHICSPFVIKLGHIVCLHDVFDGLQLGHMGVKMLVTRLNPRKIL